VRLFDSRLLLVATLLIAGCSSGPGTTQARPQAGGEAVPVTVTSVAERPMSVELRLVGSVEPCLTVGVRALVGGQLTAVHFREGDDVKKDDLLFTIDPRPFQAQLHQAEANLARDTAQAENAASQLRRYRDLVNRGIATREQLDQMTSNAEALQASVKAAAAAAENANLQLQYSTIRAPISGRAGALMVHAGNLVRANDTAPLVVLNQISPIYVAFSVPERSLADVRQAEAAHSLRVEAAIPDAKGPAERGTIAFIDNAVDTATGTIKVRGTFENSARRLWPGVFVNVLLTLRVEPQAIVVPSRAVQDAQQGQYVYVVKADQTVESRPVTVARTVGDQAVVTAGVAPGETIVTDGHLRLAPGKRVTIAKPATAVVPGR
jgi:multidrug efflux system membrane fusion protein